MQERSVTVGGETHPLEQPFFVLATQNPLEMEGTYPLPEAQLDRFFFKLKVHYPSARRSTRSSTAPRSASDAAGRGGVRRAADLVAMGDLAREVPIAPTVRQRVVQLVLATHPRRRSAPPLVKKYVRYGASPRAGAGVHSGGEDPRDSGRPASTSRARTARRCAAGAAAPGDAELRGEADGHDSDAVLKEVFAQNRKRGARSDRAR